MRMARASALAMITSAALDSSAFLAHFGPAVLRFFSGWMAAQAFFTSSRVTGIAGRFLSGWMGAQATFDSSAFFAHLGPAVLRFFSGCRLCV